jgi:chitinase
MNKEVIRALEEKMTKRFPFGIPRKEIAAATGNILHPRTLANLDSLGQGIKNRFKMGRLTVYPVPSVLEFISSKMQSGQE